MLDQCSSRILSKTGDLVVGWCCWMSAIQKPIFMRVRGEATCGCQFEGTGLDTVQCTVQFQVLPIRWRAPLRCESTVTVAMWRHREQVSTVIMTSPLLLLGAHLCVALSYLYNIKNRFQGFGFILRWRKTRHKKVLGVPEGRPMHNTTKPEIIVWRSSRLKTFARIVSTCVSVFSGELCYQRDLVRILT